MTTTPDPVEAIAALVNHPPIISHSFAIAWAKPAHEWEIGKFSCRITVWVQDDGGFCIWPQFGWPWIWTSTVEETAEVVNGLLARSTWATSRTRT